MDHKKIMQTVQLLNKYKNLQSPVLSVYLGDGGKKAPTANLLLSQFHSLIHKNLSDKEQEKFKLDIKKIENYLKDSFDSRGKRSLVFFAAGKKLFEVLDFEFSLPLFCTVSSSPYLRQIIKALGVHDKYLVLLVDRKRARLFTVHLGKIEEHADVFGEYVPQKVKSGDDTWDQQNKIFRHIEDHLHRHLKLIIQKTAEFAKDKNVNFIIIGGHRQLFSKIKKLFPALLAKKISGEFVTELNIPLNDVFLHSKKVAANINGSR